MKKTIFRWLTILVFLIGGSLSVWTIPAFAGEVSTKGQVTLYERSMNTTEPPESSVKPSISDNNQASGSDSSGKLLATGEILKKSISIIGMLIVLLVILLYFRRKKEETE